MATIWIFRRNFPQELQVFYILLLFFGCPLTLFKFNGVLTTPRHHVKQKGKLSSFTTEDTAIIEDLNQQIVEQKTYREAGLTIKELASKLRVPEYKLRRVINQQMGFRNFNQYLNAYRLKEAEDRLKNEDVAILTISLELGYKSLSSFNKVFREAHSMTPTEFRAISLDSENNCSAL